MGVISGPSAVGGGGTVIRTPKNALSITTDTPGAPSVGDIYIVPVGATGLFATHDNKIATFTSDGWEFYTPIESDIAYVDDADDPFVFTGLIWKEFQTGASGPHAMGGVDHTADTLANVNTKISDATLIDTTDSRLSDVRTPTAHKTSHQSGGGDAIQLDNLAAPDDNTDLDATTSLHGLLPKLGGGIVNFLRADGTWAAAGAASMVGVQVYYVGKHGNDSNDGKGIGSAFLTFGAAVAAVNTQTPSSSNPFAIVCEDGGRYTEDVTMPVHTALEVPGIELLGKLTMNDGVRVDIGKITATGLYCVHFNHNNESYLRARVLSAATDIAVYCQGSFGTYFLDIDDIVCPAGGKGVQCHGGETFAKIGRVKGIDDYCIYRSNANGLMTFDVGKLQLVGNSRCVYLTGAGGDTRLNIGEIRAVGASASGLYCDTDAEMEAVVGRIECTNAFTVANGGELNLLVGKLSGTEVLAGSGVANVTKAGAGAATVGQQVYYVGKHGSDANTGKDTETAFLTISAALSAASGDVPSAINRINIEVVDGGTYTEGVVVPSYVTVNAPGAEIVGAVSIATDACVIARRLRCTTAPCVTKSAADGTGYLRAQEIVTTGSIFYHGIHVTRGTLVIDVDTINASGNGLSLDLGFFAGSIVGRVGKITAPYGLNVDVNSGTTGDANLSIDEIVGSTGGFHTDDTGNGTLNLYIGKITGTTYGYFLESATIAVNLIAGEIIGLQWAATAEIHAIEADGARAVLERVYNDTGATLTKGMAVYRIAANAAHLCAEVDKTIASDASKALRYAGLIFEDIDDGAPGFIISHGPLRGFDTSGLSLVGGLYVDGVTAGALTNTAPKAPDIRVLVGGVLKVDASDGIVNIDSTLALQPTFACRDYHFTSQGIGSGTWWKGGFYDWPATDANLDEGGASITYGATNQAWGAHAGIVASGAGSATGGVVGLRISGTSVQDDGTRTPADTEVLSADITSLATDQYIESVKNWIGVVTWELYTVSGTPTVFSLDFNYGMSAYDDIGNRDLVLADMRVDGLAGAADSGFDIKLRHHKTTGWTYSAGAFAPGNGVLASWATDFVTEKNLISDKHFKWKRTGLDESILGKTNNEGLIVEIITGSAGSIQSMDIHVDAYLDIV